VVLAEQQFAGRGRRGRRWISPFARNIYCSIVWQFDLGGAALEGLSLAIGVGVARALEASGVNGVMLKWPNDVLHEQRKLAGILLEVAGDVSGRCQVVIGVGINVSMSDVIDSVSIDQPWTDVNTAAGKSISRNELAANLITHLLKLLNEFTADGFRKFHEDWSRLDCANGKPVAVHVGEQIVHGIAAGIDMAGALAVDTELGRQWFHGGEISLRLQN
jgi:BirA family biotin operon repressor/biotin-[acetyl-CoA-carboxylase] ligase